MNTTQPPRRRPRPSLTRAVSEEVRAQRTERELERERRREENELLAEARQQETLKRLREHDWLYFRAFSWAAGAFAAWVCLTAAFSLSPGKGVALFLLCLFVGGWAFSYYAMKAEHLP